MITLFEFVFSLDKKRFPLKHTDKWGLLFQCFHTFFHPNFVLSVENSSLAHNNDSILLVKPFNEAHDFPYFPLEKHEQSWHGVIFLNFHFQIEPSSCKKSRWRHYGHIWLNINWKMWNGVFWSQCSRIDRNANFIAQDFFHFSSFIHKVEIL